MRALVVASVLLAALPALPCDPLLRVEPADIVSGGAPVLDAPVGGVWWVSKPSRAGVEVALEREDGTDLDADALLVHRGPRLYGVRVPDEAAPGDRFRAVFAGGLDGSSTVLRVSDGPQAASDDEGDVAIERVGVEALSETRADACTVGFAPREEVALSIVEIVPVLREGRSADELRIDAWVLPPDGEPPGEEDERALDAFRAIDTGAGSDERAVRFRVSLVGEHDVLVRLVDPLTGARSEIERVRIANDSPRAAGWDLFGGWHWGCAQTSLSDRSLLALLSLGLLFRRRRRPCAR